MPPSRTASDVPIGLAKASSSASSARGAVPPRAPHTTLLRELGARVSDQQRNLLSQQRTIKELLLSGKRQAVELLRLTESVGEAQSNIEALFARVAELEAARMAPKEEEEEEEPSQRGEEEEDGGARGTGACKEVEAESAEADYRPQKRRR